MTIRRLAAILAADVAGFSAMMERDEESTHRRVRAFRREVIEPALAAHAGRLVKTTGDGFLAEFASPVEAVRAALAIQASVAEREAASDDPLRLRIGVNFGDVIVEDDGDVYGEGVNIAARLEQIAEPGGVCVSGKVHDEVDGKVGRPFEFCGEQQVKNIARPVRVYATALAGGAKRGPKPLKVPDKPSIAVLPFTNLSGDPEQEYFADGVVEDIITALSRLKWLFVIARNSSFTYKGRAVDVSQVGRELGVRYVLEGSIRQARARIRITGQLIEAETNHHIWADHFDGSAEDVFDLQDRVTESVVGALQPGLRGAEIDRARSTTQALTAYNRYLLGLASFYSATATGLREAQRLVLEAVDLDPQYSLAKATAARIISLRKLQTGAAPDEIAQGIALARQALADHRDDPETLGFAGQSVALLARDFDGGLSAVKRAVALNRNSAQVLGISGWTHNYVSETATAIEHFQRAIRLSPVDPEMAHFVVGIAAGHFIDGRYDEALEYGLRAMHHTPSYTGSHRVAASALVELGRVDEARDVARRLLEVTPGFRLGAYTFPFRDPELIKRWFGALRAAGLPE
jgi:adenylate cyclase